MKHRKGRTKATRRKMWNSIRIIRRFTLPDICRTVEEAQYANVRKFVASLERHGYVAKDGRYRGGRPGDFQTYRLVIDAGPEYPTVCGRCRQSLASPCKETEKEKNKEAKKEEETEQENPPLQRAGGER
ncbi:hypothetical protein [Desulfuromonas sp. TF]|uniref:hypothetical protein n=1 Tax=Desulfuromonas sp. TF TaxID=1232410 RepID=UPI0012DFDACD|nr:hypothetical protein [Desulfuromonas sp. TF]